MLRRTIPSKLLRSSSAMATAAATSFCASARATALPATAAAASSDCAATSTTVVQQYRFHSSGSSNDKNKNVIVRWSKAGWEALRHLYHGFQLFWLNTKMAWIYSRRLRSGTPLTRRERLLLERATKDLLRLVPFSFFIIVPFAEFLLPVALKIFPELIPSTFETEAQGKNKAFQKVNATRVARKRLVEYMSLQVLHYDHANKISDVLRRTSSGDPVHYDHIKIVAPMCAKTGPLSVHTIPYDVLASLAQVCGVYQSYYAMLPASVGAPRLREAVLAHFRKLRKDDQALRDEGLEHLTSDELVKANFARGMRWTETDEALTAQLAMWLKAAGESDVPYSTLFWVKPTEHSLHRTMMKLPIESRRKLLGISNLPISVRESLERVIENVHEERDVTTLADKETSQPDDLAEIVKSRKEDFSKAATRDLVDNNAAKDIIAYLNKYTIDALFTEIETDKPKEAAAKAAAAAANAAAAAAAGTTSAAVGTSTTTPATPPSTSSVTVSDIIEHLAADVHHSSHEVSKVFDNLEMGKGSDRITRATLQSFVDRLRAIHEEAAAEAKKKAAEAAAPTNTAAADAPKK